MIVASVAKTRTGLSMMNEIGLSAQVMTMYPVVVS